MLRPKAGKAKVASYFRISRRRRENFFGHFALKNTRIYPDPDDETGKFVTVNVKPVKPLKKPVTLSDMKSVPDLENMKLIRQVRLSVCPVTEDEWKIITQMGGV